MLRRRQKNDCLPSTKYEASTGQTVLELSVAQVMVGYRRPDILNDRPRCAKQLICPSFFEGGITIGVQGIPVVLVKKQSVADRQMDDGQSDPSVALFFSSANRNSPPLFLSKDRKS